MYKAHFGLTEVPFGLTPNTQFYHPLVPHFEALQVLTTALASGEGFIKVTGEVGTGKTLICRKLLNELGEHYVIAYLPNPYLTPNEMRAAIASELSIDTSLDQQQLTQALNHRLIALSGEDKQVVLLIDEAQMLPHETLEALRLISNLETESKKLMQVVLFGQPELDVRLKQDDLRQLRQRITFSYQLRPLLTNETASYVEHRLTVSGYRGAPLFEAKALRLLHQASGGIPRLINILAHKCLMLSYGQNVRNISAKLVKLAIKDTDSAIQPRNLRLPIMVSILVIEIFLVIWWFGESML
ncbi:ExeA family protein [Moritella sp. Urea-trap-13]|uniref:ExeA family protein n=1 Tax=Moritella sp. Urea-trap-13 TaxID=2058327 RepID=UPI000C333BAB|nr:AAA family ATPase [Moritella sp. Urea-trap-13]PKH05150.1 AAA family ATPase [Moritella sp. Urea-trap-13]